MAANLTGQVRNIAEVTTAGVAKRPDLSKGRSRWDVGRARNPGAEESTINTMVDQLNAFSGEGDAGWAPRGGHRGQARRPGAGCSGWPGTWKGNPPPTTVNLDGGRNLTGQVRNIAEVTTAVGQQGDLVERRFNVWT